MRIFFNPVRYLIAVTGIELAPSYRVFRSKKGGIRSCAVIPDRHGEWQLLRPTTVQEQAPAEEATDGLHEKSLSDLTRGELGLEFYTAMLIVKRRAAMMLVKRFRFIGILLALALAATACVAAPAAETGQDMTADETMDDGESGALTGKLTVNPGSYYPSESMEWSETNPNPHNMILTLIDEYQALHPGVEIEFGSAAAR